MKLHPVRDWINGVAMLHKKQDGMIELPHSPKGVTRFYLIEAVSEAAAAAGYAPGEIIIAKQCWDIVLYGGAKHIVKVPHTEVLDKISDVTLEEFTTLDGKPVLGSLDPDIVEATRAYLARAA